MLYRKNQTAPEPEPDIGGPILVPGPSDFPQQPCLYPQTEML